MSAIQYLPYDVCVLKQKTPDCKASLFFMLVLSVVDVFLAELVS